MDELERQISLAEIAWKSGRTTNAIRAAQNALKLCSDESKICALKIFIARAESKLGHFKESNAIYRELINEKIYLPPVISGLLYNNFKLDNDEKVRHNIRLMKIFLPGR